MCMCGSGILLAVGVSSRNLVSRTFPQLYQSMLTPMPWETAFGTIGNTFVLIDVSLYSRAR